MIALIAITKTWKTIIMIVAMLIVFYFFLIRPQRQEAKKEAEFHDKLKSGDRIMTAGGIHGIIVSTDATQAVVEIAKGTRIKVAKSTLQRIPERTVKK